MIASEMNSITIRIMKISANNNKSRDKTIGYNITSIYIQSKEIYTVLSLWWPIVCTIHAVTYEVYTKHTLKYTYTLNEWCKANNNILNTHRQSIICINRMMDNFELYGIFLLF